jgi:hypothetical protein
MLILRAFFIFPLSNHIKKQQSRGGEFGDPDKIRPWVSEFSETQDKKPFQKMKVVPLRRKRSLILKIKGGKMEHRISILFFAKKSKSKDENVAPVYIRITINGARIEQATNRTADLTKWSATAGRLKGIASEAKTFNSFFDALKNKVYAYERELVQGSKEITFEHSAING